MAFDFKKEFKRFYKPSENPEIIEIPKMNFIAVQGKGNTNEKEGDVEMLYGVAYTLKMSYKTQYKIEGFFKFLFKIKCHNYHLLMIILC